MGLIWNNEYVLEKNKEPHKTGYSSTEATEMADNCFQVWHCSVNEFVLFCGRLTVCFVPFISVFFTHTRALLIFFSLPLFSCYLASIFTLSLAPSMPSLSLSLFQSFSLSFLSVPHSLPQQAFYIFALLIFPFLCFVRSLGANNKKNSLFCCTLLTANSLPWLQQPHPAVFSSNCY